MRVCLSVCTFLEGDLEHPNSLAIVRRRGKPPNSLFMNGEPNPLNSSNSHSPGGTSLAGICACLLVFVTSFFLLVCGGDRVQWETTRWGGRAIPLSVRQKISFCPGKSDQTQPGSTQESKRDGGAGGEKKSGCMWI